MPVTIAPPLEGMVVKRLQSMHYVGYSQRGALQAMRWRAFYLLDVPCAKFALRIVSMLAFVTRKS